jgi:hypothetical protein
METNSHVFPTAFVRYPMELSDLPLPFQAVSPAALAARSEKNVSQWTSYLPAECVTAMIEMGWDITT